MGVRASPALSAFLLLVILTPFSTHGNCLSIRFSGHDVAVANYYLRTSDPHPEFKILLSMNGLLETIF